MPNVKIPGLTSGNGSIMHVAKVQVGGATTGRISSMKNKTVAKIFGAATINGTVEGFSSALPGTMLGNFAQNAAPNVTVKQGAACALAASECVH